MRPSRTFSLVIDRPCADVYGFVSDPQNINHWMVGVLAQPLRQIEGPHWESMSDGHRVAITFTPPNPYFVQDVTVDFPDGSVRHYRARVFPNGEGTEVCCTVIQRAEETDAVFASECEWLRTDLNVLKAFLEGQ